MATGMESIMHVCAWGLQSCLSYLSFAELTTGGMEDCLMVIIADHVTLVQRHAINSSVPVATDDTMTQAVFLMTTTCWALVTGGKLSLTDCTALSRQSFATVHWRHRHVHTLKLLLYWLPVSARIKVISPKMCWWQHHNIKPVTLHSSDKTEVRRRVL